MYKRLIDWLIDLIDFLFHLNFPRSIKKKQIKPTNF